MRVMDGLAATASLRKSVKLSSFAGSSRPLWIISAMSALSRSTLSSRWVSLSLMEWEIPPIIS